MPKQTAIAKVNEQYLKDRENGYTREYSNTENTARQMLEEYEREQREEEQRRQQRQYAQFQSRQNAELADWIRGMSPSALADDAQQRRLDTAQGIYTTDADTKHQGSGRSFGTQEVSTPKAQKKRAENDTYRKYLAQYDGVSNQTLFNNADYMQNSARAAQMERDRMASDMLTNPSLIYDQDFTQGLRGVTAKADATAQAANRLTDEYNRVANMRRKLEESEQFDSLRQNEDYAKYSQGNAETAARADKSLSPKMIRYYNIYNRAKIQAGATTGAPAEAYVNDDEAGRYFYIWEKQGADAADAYYKTYVKSRAQERRTNAERANVQALAASSPVMGAAMSAASVPLQATGIIGMIDLTVQNTERRLGINTDKPINYNTAWQAPSGQASAIRESVANKIQTDVTKNLIESGHSEKNANLWGTAASFLYQTGMSMADSGVQALLVRVGLPQEAMLTLMAGGAGMNAIREAKQRGASDGEALAYGYAAAFAEGIFEHVSLENLMTAKTPENFWQGAYEVLKQSFAEGSEEFATTYANTLTDMLINGGQSEISQKALGYMADGLSNKEAYKAAAINWLKGAGMDFLGGALSGGAMGAGNVGVNLALNTAQRVQIADAITDYQNRQAAAETYNRQMAEYNRQNAPQEATTPPLPTQAAQEQQERVSTPPVPRAQQSASETATEGRLRIPDQNKDAVLDAMRTVNPALAEAYTAENEAVANAVNAVTKEVQKGTISAEAGAELVNQMFTAAQDADMQRAYLQSIYNSNTGELTPQALNAAKRLDNRPALRVREQANTPPVPGLTVRSENGTLNENRQEEVNGQAETAAPAETAEQRRAREESAAFREQAGKAAGREVLDGSEWRAGMARIIQSVRNLSAARNIQQRASEAARLQHQAETRNLRQVSGQELSVSGATANKTAQLAENDMMGAEWNDMVKKLAAQGITLRGVIGQIESEDIAPDGSHVMIRAFVSGDNKNIVVQVDHPYLSWQQLLAHEELHRRIKENKSYRKEVMDSLLNDDKLKPYLSQIIDKYTEAYHSIRPNMTDEEIIEELLADYRAGFDMLDPLGLRTPESAKMAKRAAGDIRAVEKKGVKGETAAESEGKGKYSREYSAAIDLLAKNELPRDTDTHIQVLDYTPQIYIDKAGAQNRRMIMPWETAYLAMNKSGDILGDYHNLGPELMKQIPEKLPDPEYVVLRPDGRINAILELRKKNKPVLVSIEMNADLETTQEGQEDNGVYNIIVTVMDAQLHYLKNNIFANGKIVHNKMNEDPADFIARLKKAGKENAESSQNDDTTTEGKVNTKGKGKSSTEFDTYNRTALLSEETVDRWLKDYASKSSPKYAQAYITRMTPDQFLKLTTSATGRLVIGQQTEELDAEKLIEATQQNPLQLRISDGEVVGHEGRHRINALMRAGVNSVPVLVFDSSNKYSKQDTPEMTLQGQDFGSTRSNATVILRDLTPLSYENRDKIVKDYGTQSVTERYQEKYNGRKTVKFSTEIETAINQSMTMEQARKMIQRAFVLGEIKEWFDGEYKNGDEWLQGEGAEAVALIVDNEESLQHLFLDKIPGIIDGDFYAEDIIEAYKNGTLTGKEKKTAAKADLSNSKTVTDSRFYAPQQIENAKELYDTASQRMTKSNEKEVIAARAAVLLYAHNKGAAETLGLTDAELNKRLRSWSNYSAKAREVSQRINAGVTESNRWTGIENSSYAMKATVTQDEVANVVGKIEGDGDGYQNKYIARTVLALDTHIDWSWLNFKFDTPAGVNAHKSSNESRCNGYYTSSNRQIHVKRDAPNTVAHEMGHALDDQWGREVGVGGFLSQSSRNSARISDEVRPWFDRFHEFCDTLADSSDIRSSYSGDIKETFARFIDRFVGWTEMLATGYTPQDRGWYNDKFTTAQYVQFARLLQEKAALDANGATRNQVLSDEAGKASTEIDAEYMAAAESGDMETAQRMVDEAAKKAGFVTAAYHGTDYYKEIRVFKGGKSGYLGPGIYLTPVRGIAQRYADKSGGNGTVYNVFTKIKNPFVVTEAVPAKEILREITGSDKVFDRRMAKEGWESRVLTKADMKKLQDLGYDGVIWRYGTSPEEYLVFDSNQIKSADPITYDDDGNIIPLSERFNPENNDIRYSVEIDPDVAKQFSMEGIEERQVQSLLRENEELKKKLKDAKAQIKTSDRTQPREEDVRRMAKDILKAYDSEADKGEITESLRELAHTIMSNDTRWTDVRDQAVRLAGRILENSNVLISENSDWNREIRNAIRSTAISFKNKSDIPDYNEWRKENFGRLRISESGIPVDTRWQELQDTYGKYYFPEEITNPTDQVLHLAELWDKLQDVYDNPFNANMAEATEFLANDIIDRVISGEMRQAPTTYADRAETRLARETLRGELRAQKIMERLEAERERRNEKIAELKEHYKSKEAKGRENRKARDMRAKIIDHARQMTTELLKPTDKKHVPESLRKSVAAVLSAIDLGSGYDTTTGQDGKTLRVGRGTEGAEQTKRTKAFLELREALLKEADGLVLDPELLGTVEEPGSLTRLVTELADVPIANMNTEQLQVVYDALRGIEGAVRSANRMLSSARWAAVGEAADAIRSENSSKGPVLQLAGAAGKAQDLTRLDMLTPEGYFHRLGKSGQAVFKMLRGAQDQFITNMTKATNDTQKIVGDTDVGALEKEKHTVTMGGEKVTMTTAQIMELYCLMQRDQGLQHINTGGIMVEPVRQGIKQTTQAEPLHPSMEELLDAVRLLTPDQIRLADAMQDYLSKDMAELGNEATLAVYGYKKFGQESKYWKIRSNKNEIQQSIEKETQTTSVANRGFTKAVNPNANTSVKIGSIFDTYSQSVNDMATYAAWLAVGEDVNRIRNYVFKDSEGQRTGTVKGILDRVIGSGGANYLQRLLADIANGAGMDDAGLTSGFVGAYKAAAIGANIRVIIQQPTAILRAAEMIDPKYLAAGLKNPMKSFERAKEYSPIAQWKDWGYFDINTGRKMKDVLFENPSKLEKVRQVSMTMAGKADSFAWGQLWGAVEAETKDKTDLRPGTKDFYEACAERFNDIIDHTQVVDGILQRSQIMRSKNAITRMAVSFMSEPTKQYNQFMSAVYDYRHSGDKKKAKQMLARTTFSMLAAGVMNVLAQSIVDALRNGDRERKYWEKLLQAFLGYNPDDDTFGEKFKTFAFSNMGELINPATYLPYAKDIMSIIQGYSVERMDMDGISDTITAITRLAKALNGEGKQTVSYSLGKAIEQGAKLLGLSAYNVDRDLTALITTIANDADMPVLQYYLNRYRYRPGENLSKDLKGILWDARQKNDGSYDIIVEHLLKDGYTQEQIDTAVMNRLSDESGFTEARKAADAEGNNNGSYDLGETLEALSNIEVSEEDRDVLLEAKLSEKQYANYTMLLQYSNYDTWLSVMREMPANLSQVKIEAVLDKRDDLTTKQKAAYWQVLSGSTSAKNNPYSQEVGAEILKAKAENQPDKEPEKVAQMRSTLSGLGIQDSKVDALAPVLGGDGTNTSKWRAVANQNLGKDQQDAVLKSVMTDAMYRNWTIVSGENISLDSYVKGREAYVDLDNSGTDQNSEWTAALEKVTFDKDTTRNNYIKGVLWQIYTGSTSTKNNPFDKTGGQKVLDAKGKGGGKGTGSNAIARLRVQKQPWEVADDMELRSMNDYGGNVDLTNRKSIPITQANIDTVHGWNNMDEARIGDRMTVASQTYNDGDTAIVVTPILPDGTLMTQRELDRYMDSIIRSGDYANADKRGIILGVFDDGDWNENLAASDEFANRLHELHERKTERRSGLRLPDIPKAAKPSSGLRLPATNAAPRQSSGLRLK